MKTIISLILLVLPLISFSFVSPSSSIPPPELARQIAKHYGIDIFLLFAIIKQESRWNPNAVSHKGAIGLMQIMPMTGDDFCGLSKEDLFDPYNNLDCGTRYFKQQLDRFGSVKLALCAYNAGPHRVDKLGRCPTYKETTNYVRKIMSAWGGDDGDGYDDSPSPALLPVPSRIVEPSWRTKQSRPEEIAKRWTRESEQPTRIRNPRPTKRPIQIQPIKRRDTTLEEIGRRWTRE